MTTTQTTDQLTILRALITHTTAGDESGDGPPEPCIAPVDLDAMADEGEAWETAWLERDGRGWR